MLNLKSYLKFLSRNKLYTFINVFGLSVSLMFVILMMCYIVKVNSTDNFQKNVDRLYVLCSEHYSFESAYHIGGHLQNRYPEIEKTCGITSVSNDIEVLNKIFDAEIVTADPTFFDMFSFKIKSGDRSQLLVAKNSAVISERFAYRIYGDKDPIGERFNIGGSEFIVSGVVENFRNSFISYQDVIISTENNPDLLSWYTSEDMRNKASVIFIQTVEGSDLTSKTDNILNYFKDVYGWYNGKYGNLEQVLLMPIKDAYNTFKFSDVTEINEISIYNNLFIVCFIILIFAITNYINLTVAQTSFRAKEMALRKLIGASNSSIFINMILESTLLCGVSFLLGLLFAISAEPYFNNLVDADISIINDFSLVLLLLYISFIILLGFVTGLVPAVIISQFKPINVVKGAFIFKSKMILSKIFITIQSTLTIIFIAYSITIVRQINHMTDVDLGYQTERIISIWKSNIDDSELFCNELRAMPFVSNIGIINTSPCNNNSFAQNFIVGSSNNEVELGFLKCDSSAMKMYKFEILQDYQIAGTGVWINEEAMKKLSENGDIRSILCTRNNTNYMIKGVIKDFMFGSAYQGRVQPIVLQVGKETHNEHEFNEILIEVNGDLTSAYNEISKLYKKMTRLDYFDGKFIDQEIMSHFDDYKKRSNIMSIFTIVAILISSLGLLAMSIYFTKQRSSEIAVRKVFGSTNSQVLKRLVWQFLRLVVVAFIIACPIIWYLLNDFLSTYAYRTNLSVWIFIAAGAFTLLISFITVYWHSSIAANENPTKSIKK